MRHARNAMTWSLGLRKTENSNSSSIDTSTNSWPLSEVIDGGDLSRGYVSMSLATLKMGRSLNVLVL